MKFPITRGTLQAFDYVKEQQDKKEEEVQKRLTLILDQLCKECEQSMHVNSKEKKFVWRQIHLIKQMSPQAIGGDQYIPQFVGKLKETFIDCDIIIDPLKTYIIIDWS
jgi:hypothetical protein